MSQFQPLNDQQWGELEPLFPRIEKRGRGKPHASWRKVANAILLVLLTGIKWSSIPVTEEYATKSVAHRWFAAWDKSGFLEKLLATYRGTIDAAASVQEPSRRNRLPKEKAVESPGAHLKTEEKISAVG